MELTNVEQLAIEKLKEVAKIWPKSLWLFSANGQLCVMKKKEGQQNVFAEDAYNSSRVVATVNFENDGGDW